MNMTLINELKQLQPETNWEKIYSEMKDVKLSNKEIDRQLNELKDYIINLNKLSTLELIEKLGERIQKIDDYLLHYYDQIDKTQRRYLENEKATAIYQIDKLREKHVYETTPGLDVPVSGTIIEE